MTTFGRILAVTALAGVSLLSAGCNTPGASDSLPRNDTKSALLLHGDPDAARAQWMFAHGDLAERPDMAQLQREQRGFRSTGLSSVWVAKHPATPELEEQAGWIEKQRNGAGVERWAFLDRNWGPIAYMDPSGRLSDRDGLHSWGERRYSIQEACRELYGKGPYIGAPSDRYNLTTTLPFRSGGEFVDDGFPQRGVTIVRREELVSIRPLGQGEMTRLSQTLNRPTFERRESERGATYLSDREAQNQSRVPELGSRPR